MPVFEFASKVLAIGAATAPKLRLLGPMALAAIPRGLADCNVLDVRLLTR